MLREVCGLDGVRNQGVSVSLGSLSLWLQAAVESWCKGVGPEHEGRVLYMWHLGLHTR